MQVSSRKPSIVKVVWSESSEFDLDDLYDYIPKDSPIHADSL